MTQIFLEAFKTRDLADFLSLVLPSDWGAIRARILESGATMAESPCPWAPRWSPVPPTIRKGANELETAVKSCIYRAHDSLHQLWGLPVPGDLNSEADFYLYKRAQMCGEVAVLTLTEFMLCQRLAQAHPTLQPLLWRRNALPMLEGPLRNRSWAEIASRLDGILHGGRRPWWLRNHPASCAFADDYVPMLAADRRNIDHNWVLMRTTGWFPTGAPNARYNPDTDGLELTLWMISDFLHLMDTDPVVDEPLAAFNRARRASITLPVGWNGAT